VFHLESLQNGARWSLGLAPASPVDGRDARLSTLKLEGALAIKCSDPPPHVRSHTMAAWNAKSSGLIVFVLLGLVADFVLPIWWALVATIPIAFVSWWVAYRSEWF
jgi:hypothetical protein